MATINQCRMIDDSGWNRVQWIPTEKAAIGSKIKLPVGKLGPREYTVFHVYEPALDEETFDTK
jgi:hypothetical protein